MLCLDLVLMLLECGVVRRVLVRQLLDREAVVRDSLHRDEIDRSYNSKTESENDKQHKKAEQALKT